MRIRVTRSRLLLGVVLLVLLIVAVILGEVRRARFIAISREHMAQAKAYEVFHYEGPGGQDYVQRFERNHRIWKYHSDMTTKYRFGSWLPWLPLSPDPPEPE